MNASRIAREIAHRVWIAAVGTALAISSVSALAQQDEGANDTLYLKIRPDMLVNLTGGDNTPVLMLSATVRGQDAEGIAAAGHHMSAIRHHLLMLLSEKSAADWTTRHGKDATRKAMLAAVRSILEGETGKPGVKDVLLTDIIVE